MSQVLQVILPQTGPNEQRQKIREEKRVNDLFGKQSVLADLRRANAVCFPLATQRMLEFPISAT